MLESARRDEPRRFSDQMDGWTWSAAWDYMMIFLSLLNVLCKCFLGLTLDFDCNLCHGLDLPLAWIVIDICLAFLGLRPYIFQSIKEC